MISNANLIGKKKNSDKAKERYEVPVGTVTRSTGKVPHVNLKFNKKAWELMDLTPVKISGKDHFKSITLFETEDHKIGVFNSTPFSMNGNKTEVSKMHNARLLKNQISLFQKLYDFNDDQNWAFTLVLKKDEFLGKTVDSFIFEKLEKIKELKPREKSPAQLAQIAETKAWFASERDNGRKPTVKRYWAEKKNSPTAID